MADLSVSKEFLRVESAIKIDARVIEEAFFVLTLSFLLVRSHVCQQQCLLLAITIGSIVNG